MPQSNPKPIQEPDRSPGRPDDQHRPAGQQNPDNNPGVNPDVKNPTDPGKEQGDPSPQR
jgi:hypothetical protein